jgi:hypothetical protein
MALTGRATELSTRPGEAACYALGMTPKEALWKQIKMLRRQLESAPLSERRTFMVELALLRSRHSDAVQAEKAERARVAEHRDYQNHRASLLS